MKFNYSLGGDKIFTNPETGSSGIRQGPPVDPEYDHPYGYPYPPIQAQRNLSYLQFIDLINELWSYGHPEIIFAPFGARSVWDSQQGYIIYSLEDKKPKTNHPRLRLYEVIDDLEDDTKKVAVFIENFNLIISFSAVHKDPRIAEEMIEAFEDFMIEHTPIFRAYGLENFSYVRRMPDHLEKRFGDDVSSRTIAYMTGIQKIKTLPLGEFEEIYIRAQVIVSSITDAIPSTISATPSYHHLTSTNVKVKLTDNNATTLNWDIES